MAAKKSNNQRKEGLLTITRGTTFKTQEGDIEVKASVSFEAGGDVHEAITLHGEENVHLFFQRQVSRVIGNWLRNRIRYYGEASDPSYEDIPSLVEEDLEDYDPFAPPTRKKAVKTKTQEDRFRSLSPEEQKEYIDWLMSLANQEVEA